MRYRGKKQAAAYRQHGPDREAFLDEMGWKCAVCGGSFQLAVHEITNGPNRMRAFGVRACWLPACGTCNCDRLTDKERWPLAAQLALKLITDPEFFDLNEVRRILAPEGCLKPPVVVTEAEVLEQVRQLLIERRVV